MDSVTIAFTLEEPLKPFIITVSLLALAGACAHADTLTGNGSFQTWNPSVLGPVASPTSGGPYWNNLSGEGPARNIGWCMTGAGNCAISNPPGALSYFGNGTSAASDMSFTGAGTAQVAKLLGAFTNKNGSVNGTDYFGWYSLNPNGTIGSVTQLFSATAAAGTSAAFVPTTRYGFYLENVQSAGKPFEADYFWFMNEKLDYTTGTGLLDPGVQHFSAFTKPGSSFYLGAEDTPGPSSDFDYNDIIVQLQPAPEPASIALLATGICLLGWNIRRGLA